MSTDTMKKTFKDILDKLHSEKILLPNFQRSFVWNDLDRQKRLLASYLCELPIGTILLLQGEKSEFSTRRVGVKKHDASNSNEEILFLLDGQQRLTTLSNMFSNIVFDNLQGNWNNLISTGLKHRFFIKINSKSDIFGLNSFVFPWKVDEEYPTYTVNDIVDTIETLPVNKNETEKKYHPSNTFSSLSKSEKREYRKWYEKERLIPLSMIYDDNEFEELESIIEKIAIDILEDLFEGVKSSEEIYEQLHPLLIEKAEIVEADSLDDIREEVAKQKDRWVGQFKTFLRKLKYQSLSVIEVPKEQRARAIEIYENINLGGVTLDEFDLLIAKAAKENPTHLDYFEEGDSLENYIVKLFKQEIDISNLVDSSLYGQWTPVNNFGVYDQGKNVLSKKLIDQYLKLLNFYDYLDKVNPNIDSMDKKIFSKRASLNLDGKSVYKHSSRAIVGLSRACAFLQLRCGLLNLSEMNYILMLIPLAFILNDDNIYKNNKALNKLEYWYWVSIFSGRYNTDQTDKMTNDIRDLQKWINENGTNSYAIIFANDFFNLPNFSDNDTILLKKASQNIFPKEVIISSIQKFILVKKKSRDFNIKGNDKILIRIGVNSKLELDSHHIIPLGAYKKIGQSTVEIRKDKAHILNCVGNKTLITKQSNNDISSLSPDEYLAHLQENFDEEGTILESHLISDSIYSINIKDDVQVANFIEARYKKIRKYIATEIENLLN